MPIVLSSIWLVIMSLIWMPYSHAQVQTRNSLAAAPLPNTTVQIDEKKGYYLKAIGDSVYYITDGIYQCMFLVTGEGIIVVDAPPSIGIKILSAIKEVSEQPITHVIYTHCHPDHIGAAAIYPASAAYITSENNAKEIAFHNRDEDPAYGAFVGGKAVPPATSTFRDSMTLVVGNKTVKLLHTGHPGHSQDDIIVYLPREKVVMLVDVVFPGWVPFEQIAYAVDIDGYLLLHRYLLGLDFNVLVGGHWSKLGTRQDAIDNMAYINDLLEGIAEGFQKVDVSQAVSKVGTGNINLLMETYFDAVASYAAGKTLAVWKDKLSGADVWTYNHARRLLPFVRDSQVTFNMK